MSSTLHIGLLGGFHVTWKSKAVTRVYSARMQSLLAYLSLNRDAPQPRQRLAFLFWPDSTERQARTNLRRELHHLRRELPQADRLLLIDTQSLQWRAGADCVLDVAEFEAAIARANAASEAEDANALRTSLQAAVALYRGELLPSCYEAWIDADRERLRQSYGAVLERLIGVLEEERDHASAIRYAERLVRHDPLRESAHARLIGLYAASGDRAGAVQAYRKCAATLSEELGVMPGPATANAYERALATGVSPPRETHIQPAPLEVSRPLPRPSPGHAALPLVGRDGECEAIREWRKRTEGADAPEVLLLQGEPGIGKTRLLDELAAEVRSAGGRTIRGRGFEAEMVRPYGAWIDALRSVPRDWISGSTDLGSLIPDVYGAAQVPTDRSRLFDMVAGFLARLSADGAPVTVLMDDVQWLDEASAALLHYLTRLLAGSPLLVACAARPGELESNAPVAGFVRALERERRVCAIELGPMDREEVTALARFVDVGIDSDRVFEDSGGNPLFALEIAHAPVQQKGGVGGSVEDLIRNRLSRLDEATRELLSWAAALGRSFDPTTAALVSGQPLPELLVALNQLERFGIIRPGESTGAGTTYDFAHDIVRRTAYTQLSEPRQRLVHLQIARALDGLPDPDGALAGDVAHHAALGGDTALAATACLSAGERCLRLFAYAEAAELARRGIRHCGELPDRERIHLHVALLRIFVSVGVSPDRVPGLEEEIRGLIAEARIRGMIDDEAVGFSLISLMNFGHDRFGQVHEHVLLAEEVGRAASPATTARMLGHTGACLAAIEREMPRAEALLLEARSLADQAGITIPDIPMGLGVVRQYAADYDEARRLLEYALRIARAEQDHFNECVCLTNLVMLDLEGDAPDRALTRCAELAPVTAKLEEGSEHAFTLALDALARYGLEETGAEVALENALSTLRRADARRKLAYVLTIAAEADLAEGRSDLAFRRAEEALDAARVVDHRSGIALAGAALVRSALALDEICRAGKELDALCHELGGMRDLSARAREAFEAVAADESLVAQPNS